MKEDFRKRCYEAFASTKWTYTHRGGKNEYEFFAKVTALRMKNILPLKKDIRIVDLACGAGHFLYFLQKEGYTNTLGIDLSAEMLTLAEKAGVKNLKAAEMHVFLQENKNNFDLIVANDIIEHVTKDEALDLLDSIHSALKPEGMVLLATPNAMSLLGFGNFHREFTHITAYTPLSLAQVLRVCRFKHIRTFGEKPVRYDLKSSFRCLLWSLMKRVLLFLLTIQQGTGRGMWKNQVILEPRIFAVAHKGPQE